MSVKSNVPTPHIEARAGEIAETILLPGDPLRAKYIAENFLSDVKQFNSVRNMFGYTGTYEGKPVSVMGTGMGCPSMGIYSYELIHFYGVKNLIRVGTAGSIHPDVHIRDLVFGIGACTTSNFPALMELPGVFAPVCSFELLRKGVEKAEQMNLRYKVGNILSSDMFYGPAEGPEASKKWSSMGVRSRGAVHERRLRKRAGADSPHHQRPSPDRGDDVLRREAEQFYGYDAGRAEPGVIRGKQVLTRGTAGW